MIALEGDGSILMALGCLTTIGMVKPRNLTIVIMDNGIYQITGKQKAATAGTADLVAIARGAGIADSHWVRDAAHFDTLMSRRFDEGGPVLLAAKIDDQGGTARPRATPPDPPALHARDRDRAAERARRLARVSLEMRCSRFARLDFPGVELPGRLLLEHDLFRKPVSTFRDHAPIAFLTAAWRPHGRIR